MSKILIFNSADDAALYTTGGDALNGSMIYNYIDSTLDTPRWNAYRDSKLCRRLPASEFPLQLLHDAQDDILPVPTADNVDPNGELSVG